MKSIDRAMNNSIDARLRKEEIKANMLNSYVAFFCLLTALILYILGIFSIYSINPFLLHAGFLTSICCLFVTLFLTHFFHGEKNWIKYMIIICFSIVTYIANLHLGGTISMVLLLPILASLRYFRRHLLLISSGIALILLLTTPFVDTLLLPRFGMIDLNSLSSKGGYTFISGDDSWLYQILVGNSIDKYELFWITILRTTLPSLGLLALLFLYGYEFIKHGKKLIVEAMEKGDVQIKVEKELNEMKSKILLSRLQPDFICDCLDSIMSIPGNPEETTQAIDDFGEFIKENLDSLDENETIRFEKELSHVERYIRLLQLSKHKSIQVDFDIQINDFQLPSLSLLTLVQYAYDNEKCTHIIISTKKEKDEILLIVKDNGLVFDKAILSDQKGRVSINSLQERISSLGGGYLQMKSSQNDGNTEIIHLPEKSAK